MSRTPSEPQAGSGADARWLTEWIEFGLRQFETYLERHRSFDDFYARRDRSADPDGRAT